MEKPLTLKEGFAMNLKRKFVAVVATFLTFSIVGFGQATADGIEVTVSAEEPFC